MSLKDCPSSDPLPLSDVVIRAKIGGMEPLESSDSSVAMTKSEEDEAFEVSKFFFGEQGGEVIWDEDYILPVTGVEMTAMDRAFVREQIEDAKYAPLLSPLFSDDFDLEAVLHTSDITIGDAVELFVEEEKTRESKKRKRAKTAKRAKTVETAKTVDPSGPSPVKRVRISSPVCV